MHKFKNILVISSHPDDEILGCGGTLYNLRKKEQKFLHSFYRMAKVQEKVQKLKNLF